MKTGEFLKRPIEPFEVANAPYQSGYTLNIAGVYQDFVTRDWAMQSCSRATRLAGEEGVQSTWYSADSLSEPGFLRDAVRDALVADVIVVSVYGAHELPLDLYVWIDAWLPRRPLRVGALTALIGFAQPLDSESARTFEYLRAVARKAKLDFVPQACQRPIASPADSIKLSSEHAGGPAQAPQELRDYRYDAYSHWGLNE